MYKTTDAGKTWHSSGLKDTHTIGKIVVDPHNANVVYAASMGHVYANNAERGIFKSTDGGAHWSKVLYVDDATGAIDLVMDNSHPNTLYAAMWQAYRRPYGLSSGGPGSGLYKTTDGGAHWTKISGQSRVCRPACSAASASASRRAIRRSCTRSCKRRTAASSAPMTAAPIGSASTTAWKCGSARSTIWRSTRIRPIPNTIYVPNARFFVSHDGGKTFRSLAAAARRQSHRLDRSEESEDHSRGQRRRCNGFNRRRQDVEQRAQSAHRAVLSCCARRSVSVQYLRRATGRRFVRRTECVFRRCPSSRPIGRRTALGESTFVAPQPGNTNIDYGSGYFSIMMRHDAETNEYNSVSPYPLYREGASVGRTRGPPRVDAPNYLLAGQSERAARRRTVRVEQHRSRPDMEEDQSRSHAQRSEERSRERRSDRQRCFKRRNLSRTSPRSPYRRSTAMRYGRDRSTGWCI